MSATIAQAVSLQPYNSMAVPAMADHLLVASSLEELRDGLDWANQQSLPWLALGEGSNTLFVDDFHGLIVLLRMRGIDVLSEDEDAIVVRVAAGENWHQLVAHTIEQGWRGLENLALIPGLVGAAPIQNIGAYGVELKDVLLDLEYLDAASGELHQLDNAECQFAYRDSIFKHALAGQAIVTSITLRLSLAGKCRIDYPALKTWFADAPEPTAAEVFAAVCAIRSSKLPLPAQLPNTGSFFKNPVVAKERFTELQRNHPGIVGFAAGETVKVAAGWLIEQAGWKSREHCGVRVHQQQALVIINPQRSPGKHVLELAQLIREDIQDKFGLSLEIEPRVVG